MLQPRLLRPASVRCLGQAASAVRTYARVVERAPVNAGAVVINQAELNVPETRTRDQAKLMKSYVPRTPGQRWLKRPINDHLHKGQPYKPLTWPKIGHGKGGRNVTGQITVRHRGGGVRRRIRIVDWERKDAGQQLVKRIEYDPNRSAHIALLQNVVTKKFSYILAPVGLRAGDKVESFRPGIPQSLMDLMGGRLDPGMFAAETCVKGNCLPVQLVPPGTQICAVGSHPKRGAVFARSAGTFATVMGPDASGTSFKNMVVKLSSGEVRKVDKNACATVGVSSNPMWQYRTLGKAGRSRWLNIRPTVRGLAMNANEHPHGGGRGKSKGNRIPMSPWGKQAKSGKKTRPRAHKNKWVVERRVRNMGKRRETN